MKVCRIAYFNSAHRLYNPDWNDEKNNEVFGKCNNPNYHGHNYKIEVWIEGSVDQETGYLIDLKILKQIIKNEITDAFDHKNLNLDCPEFKNLIPTLENICIVCWNKLSKALDNSLNISVRIWETENNLAAYSGE